jgi:hypothetical protein
MCTDQAMQELMSCSAVKRHACIVRLQVTAVGNGCVSVHSVVACVASAHQAMQDLVCSDTLKNVLSGCRLLMLATAA